MSSNLLLRPRSFDCSNDSLKPVNFSKLRVFLYLIVKFHTFEKSLKQSKIMKADQIVPIAFWLFVSLFVVAITLVSGLVYTGDLTTFFELFNNVAWKAFVCVLYALWIFVFGCFLSVLVFVVSGIVQLAMKYIKNS